MLQLTSRHGDRLLTSSEVAELFGVDRTTVMRWANTGQISGIHTPGGYWRFRQSDVNRLMHQALESSDLPDVG